MDLRQEGTLADKCLDIKSPGTVDISNVIEKVVTCSYRDDKKYIDLKEYTSWPNPSI